MEVKSETIHHTIRGLYKKFAFRYIPIHVINQLKYLYHFGPGQIGKLKNPYFFIHLPKCAGVSIRQYLIEHKMPTLILDHAVLHTGYRFPYTYLRKHDPRAFCVIRNPFERLASAYFFLSEGGKHGMDADIFNRYLSPYKDFRDFVYAGLGHLEKSKELIQLMHLIPQTTFLMDEDGDLCVASDNILRFEQLSQDFDKYIRSRGRIPGALPWKNRTESGPRYKNLYKREDGSIDQDMVNVVIYVYRKDFDALGYAARLEDLA